MKVRGVLKKLKGMMDGPIDLMVHILKLVPKAPLELTVGETLDILESSLS
jgi:hypothetical protein